MSEKPTPNQPSQFSEADLQRFENDLPQWLLGQLSPAQAQWMQKVQQRHAHLANEAAWLVDFKAVVRQEAIDENTDAAWSELTHRLVESAPHKQRTEYVPRQWLLCCLHWLLGHPGWAHTAAALVIVLVLGQATWIVSTPEQMQRPEWRSLEMVDLQVAATQSVRVKIQLRAGSLGTDMAALAVVAAGSADAVWQAQPDGTWVLTISPVAQDAQALLARLQAQPAVVQAQLLD